MANSIRKERPISFRAVLGEPVVQQEMLLFVLVSAMDVFMTYIMLRQSGRFFESNPVAQFFIEGWGIKGMVYFKFATVAFVCLLAQIISQRKPVAARLLLLGATGLVALVVVYSLMLFTQHGGIDPVELSTIINLW